MGLVSPCEGGAGTGMAAASSVRIRTGNVSAGTSGFAVVVDLDGKVPAVPAQSHGPGACYVQGR